MSHLGYFSSRLAGIALGVVLAFGLRALTPDSVDLALTRSHAAQVYRDTDPSLRGSARDAFSQLVSAIRVADSLESRLEIYHTLSQVPPAELAGLIERAQKLPLIYRRALSNALFERWIETDPATATTWVKQKGRGSGCYAAWARLAPQEALDHFFRTDHDGSYTDIAPQALAKLAGPDPRAQMDLLARYPESTARHDAIGNGFMEWKESDPEAALNWITTLPDGPLRTMLREEGLTALAGKDPVAAVLHLQEMIPDLPATIVGNSFLSMFTWSLAAKDPTLAMKLAEALPSELQTHPLIAAGSAWAKLDPLPALDWALERGIDLTQRLRTEAHSTSTNILGQAMATQPEQTVEWLRALPEGPQRDAWLSEALFRATATLENDIALRMFDSLSPDAQVRAAAVLGRKLASGGELPSLKTWESQFPDEDIRARAIGGAISELFYKIPARAESVVAELPEGPIRDRAIFALAASKRHGTPAAAAEQALQIRGSILRYDALDTLLNSWMERDRPSAETWLDTQPDLPREWVSEWRTVKPGVSRPR